MDTVIGIDLGTTNSEVAVLTDGQARIIPVDGESIMPSCVGINPAGELLVGRSAKNQMVVAPEDTILSIKRKMGTNTLVTLGEKSFSPEEISALILNKLKKVAQNHLGIPVRKAVITVPAYFDDTQRKATRNAGELAGLDVLRIINEPTAAALAYDAGLEKDQVLLVYDLGGGTFDVSLVVVEKGVVEVKASHGDTHLGGDDFDQLLMEHVAGRFQEQAGVNLLDSAKSKNRLWQVVEAAKRTLSDVPFVNIREEFFSDDHHLVMEISRLEYEEMVRPLVRKTLDSVNHCLKDAGMLPKDVDQVILVGGASRTPLISEMIRTDLNLMPHVEIDPDLIVAMGAAIQAGVIAGHPASSVLVDINPHSIGTSIVGVYNGDLCAGLFCPVIQRNTPLPVKKSEVFYTMIDGQKSVDVRIYQGEDNLVEENIFIGNFIIEGLSEDASAGNELILNLNLDLSGMLEVTAEEKRSGLSKTVRMETGCFGDELDIDSAHRNLSEFIMPGENLSEDTDQQGKDGNSDDLYESSDRLVKRALMLQQEIDPTDAKELDDLIQKSKDAVQNKNLDDLAELNESLSDMLFYLEE